MTSPNITDATSPYSRLPLLPLVFSLPATTLGRAAQSTMYPCHVHARRSLWSVCRVDSLDFFFICNHFVVRLAAHLHSPPPPLLPNMIAGRRGLAAAQRRSPPVPPLPQLPAVAARCANQPPSADVRWEAMSAATRLEMLVATASWWRRRAFPFYPQDVNWRVNALNDLRAADPSGAFDATTKTLVAGRHTGTALASSYHPHMFSVRRRQGDWTPWDAFHDQDKRLQLLELALRRFSPGGIAPNRLRATLSCRAGSRMVSNFRPLAAAAVYRRVLGRSHRRTGAGNRGEASRGGARVWDMSAGWGGRLLGAWRSNVVAHYIGTDPSARTHEGLSAMARTLKQKRADGRPMRVTLLRNGSEDFRPRAQSLDLCFTSPPYLDTEMYCHEPSQAHVKFPSRAAFVNRFLHQTLRNCHYGLKRGRHCVVNVAATRYFPDAARATIAVARRVGFVHVDTWQYGLRNGNGAAEARSEPVLIFRKP